jgi:hypothetical protein
MLARSCAMRTLVFSYVHTKKNPVAAQAMSTHLLASRRCPLNRWPGRTGVPIEEHFRERQASCAELEALPYCLLDYNNIGHYLRAAVVGFILSPHIMFARAAMRLRAPDRSPWRAKNNPAVTPCVMA